MATRGGREKTRGGRGGGFRGNTVTEIVQGVVVEEGSVEIVTFELKIVEGVVHVTYTAPELIMKKQIITLTLVCYNIMLVLLEGSGAWSI